MPRPLLWRTGTRRVYFSSHWTVGGSVRGEVHGYLVHVNHTTPRIYSVFTPDTGKLATSGWDRALVSVVDARRYRGQLRGCVSAIFDGRSRGVWRDLPILDATCRGTFYRLDRPFEFGTIAATVPAQFGNAATTSCTPSTQCSLAGVVVRPHGFRRRSHSVKNVSRL